MENEGKSRVKRKMSSINTVPKDHFFPKKNRDHFFLYFVLNNILQIKVWLNSTDFSFFDETWTFEKVCNEWMRLELTFVLSWMTFQKGWGKRKIKKKSQKKRFRQPKNFYVRFLKKNTCVGSCSVLPVGEVLILADLNEPPVLLLPRVPLRS